MGKSRDSGKVTKALKKKGFIIDKTKKKHIHFVYIDKNNMPTNIKTYISHGPNAGLGATLISRMALQLNLSSDQFLKLVDCDMDQNGYENIMKQKGIIRL